MSFLLQELGLLPSEKNVLFNNHDGVLENRRGRRLGRVGYKGLLLHRSRIICFGVRYRRILFHCRRIHLHRISADVCEEEDGLRAVRGGGDGEILGG